jgi:hypothetical protein
MSKKAADPISRRQSTIRMPRITTAKQLSIMRPDTTKKRPIMHAPQGDTLHTPQGDTRFTRGITPTKLPSFTWRTTARIGY